MIRDHVIFLVGGLLVGFITGYVLHDTMAARQPPRFVPGSGNNPQAAAPAPAQPQAQEQTQEQAAASMAQIQQLKQYVDEHPDDLDATLQLANLNYDVRNFGRAKELYLHYLEKRPKSPDVTSDLGICFRELGDYKQALDYFHRTQEMSPNHWESRFNEVVVQAFDLKNYAAAEKALQKLEELQPNNPDVKRLAEAVAKQKGAA